VGVKGVSDIGFVRMLFTCSAADAVVNKYGLAESTLLQCLKRFCALLSTYFTTKQLRFPTVDEIWNIESIYAPLGFPGPSVALTVLG
jgi:hypothetical protein